MDVLRPDTEDPTTMSALGTKIEAVGFANPSHFAATFKAFTGKHPHGVR